MAGKKGDIYSLGLMFTEITLVIFGRPSLRDQYKSGCFSGVTDELEEFIDRNFAVVEANEEWCPDLCTLLGVMLHEDPIKRPKANAV
jgi:hypothetical protein